MLFELLLLLSFRYNILINIPTIIITYLTLHFEIYYIIDTKYKVNTYLEYKNI